MKRAMLAVALAVIALVGVGSESATANSVVTRDGELVADGAWCWFQDARAVHYVGAHDRTYVGYIDSVGDVDLISQDARTAALVHVRLHVRLQADDHAAPGLTVLPGGRIFVAYSKHSVSPMYYRISTNPEDVSSFGPEQVAVPANVTYANPIYLSAEHRLYLFFRGSSAHPSFVSTTDYVHWTAPQDVMVPDSDHLVGFPGTRPYAKYATNGVDRITMAFTDGHPREDTQHGVPTSLYSIEYQTGVGWHTPAGTPLSLPVSPDVLKSAPDAVVYRDPGNTPAWVSATAIEPTTGHPVVAYPVYHGLDPSDAEYHYARWNGSDWVDTYVTNAGASIATANPNEMEYSGGMDIDRNDPRTVYLSRETTLTSGVWDVEQWHTSDGGRSFARQAIVTPNPTVKNVRPVVPWGRPGEIAVLWMSGSYVNYSSGGYHTQLREWTNGLAPTTTRISVSARRIRAGRKLIIGGRVVQGYYGSPVPYATVELWQQAPGRVSVLSGRARADANGLVRFVRYPRQTVLYSVWYRHTTNYGGSHSPALTIRVYR